MKPVAILILVVAVLFAVFVLANWAVFVTPTVLSFLAFSVEAPLGLILLGVIVLLIVLFAVHEFSLRASMFLETRRHAQEIREQRELADKAEASRFTELRSHFDQELERLSGEIRTSSAANVARVDAVERTITASVNEATNSLSASLGNIDYRLDSKGLPGPDR